MGIFEKFKIGFKKSASTFTSGLRDIIVKKEIDDKTLDQFEDYLIESDVGVAAASEIKKIISTEKIDPKNETLNEVNLILKNYIIKLMKPLEKDSFFNKNEKLKIILISGVNGVGKTTTIGKIGKILKSNENKILFSACDTFRAAAIEQLENWAKKIDVEIIKSSIKKLNEWKNILDLIPSKFKKNIQLKKSGLCGLFSASLELSREGFISIMQKKTFDKLLIKEKK